MKPVLKQYLQTVDCTTIAFKDASVIPTTLPNFLLLKVTPYDKFVDETFIVINSTSTVTLGQFLTGTVYLLNSYNLGKSLLNDPLIELNCGIIAVEYHWFYTTDKTISYTKGKYELNGTGLTIKDSVFIQGRTYTINKARSTTSKLITNEPLAVTGASVLVYGEYDSFYFINECVLQRGLVLASGKLSVLNCEEATQCLGSEDKTEVRKILDDFIKLNSARIKLACGDVVSANQIVKSLCTTYASQCYNANSVLSNCGCQNIKVQQGCTTCDG